MITTSGSYFHLHLVSDSTGETLITVARAVAAQYANVTPVEHVYPLVRSQKLRLIVRRPLNEPPAAIEKLEVVGDHRVTRIERIGPIKLSPRRSQIATQHVRIS